MPGLDGWMADRPAARYRKSTHRHSRRQAATRRIKSNLQNAKPFHTTSARPPKPVSWEVAVLVSICYHEKVDLDAASKHPRLQHLQAIANGAYVLCVGDGGPWPVATRAIVPHMIDLMAWGFGKMNMDNQC